MRIKSYLDEPYKDTTTVAYYFDVTLVNPCVIATFTVNEALIANFPNVITYQLYTTAQEYVFDMT